ncbi:ubiquitin-conjugating enzyme E2 G2 isoform X2 [Notamacropus eugenii]|uniref:ubiquitin-conjugating enzyme E2 G2 isoform X2 n=1 Tax=Notamacropus eugenii TaxID=9315 RepID=UPI003B67844F
MAGTALKRLMAEYKQLTLNPPEGIVAGPMNEENFFEWEALIMGPEDTCFEFGVFPAILSFPLDYPLSPPKMRFTCEMFHPNMTSLRMGWPPPPRHSWDRGLHKELLSGSRESRPAAVQCPDCLPIATFFTVRRAQGCLQW